MSVVLEDKIAVFECLVAQVEEKCSRARSAYEFATNALQSEQKSTAGDKHETGRAMAQLEQEKAAGQIAEANKLKAHIVSLTPDKKSEVVESGALVKLNTGMFYFSVGLGVIPGTAKVFALSMASPLGAELSGMKEGDEIVFNGKKIVVESIV